MDLFLNFLVHSFYFTKSILRKQFLFWKPLAVTTIPRESQVVLNNKNLIKLKSGQNQDLLLNF